MKKLQFIFLIVLGFALLSVNSFAQKTKKVVRAERISQVPTTAVEDKKLGLTVERYVANYEVNADKTAVATVESLQRIDSEKVIESFKTFEQIFNSDLETVEVLEAYKISGGTKIVIPEASIQTKLTPQGEAAPGFSSLKFVKIDFGDLKVGDRISYKIKVTDKKNYFEGHFSGAEFFSSFFAWDSVEINISAPKEVALYIDAEKLNGGKIADENNRSRWQWKAQNLPAQDLEIGIRSPFDDSPRLAVTTFKNFEELGATYWLEASKKAAVTPKIQKLADEITKDIKDPQLQAAAIYEWTNKNIRYLLVVLDKGGWIPHSAESIIENGYGDCKDYVTVLHALLSAKGIESQPLLINANSLFWFPKVATPSVIDHVILYIPSLDTFADATAPNTRLGLLPAILNGKTGILAGNKTGILGVPSGKSEESQFLSDSVITFEPSGNIRSVSKNSYIGRAEMLLRPLSETIKAGEGESVFIKLMLTYFGIDGSGKVSKISNPTKIDEPFNIEFEASVADYTTFTPTGRIHVPQGLNLISTGMLEMFVNNEKRKTQMFVGASEFKENFELVFPENVIVQSVPQNVRIENETGLFSTEYKLENNIVKVNRLIVIKKDLIEPNEYEKFSGIIKKSLEDKSAEISYQADKKLLAQKSVEKRVARKTNAKVSSHDIYETLYDPLYNVKTLTPPEVRLVENKLKKTPDDLEARRQLLKYYNSEPRTAQKLAGRTRQRIWFVQNHPEKSDEEVLGFAPYLDKEDEEYIAIKTEWLKQVQLKPDNLKVRLNAAEFIGNQSDEAEKLLSDGINLFPENIEFPSKLFAFYNEKTSETKDLKLYENSQLKAYEIGEKTLALLKKERSRVRDDKRADIMPELALLAFKLEKYDRAKQLANEANLEFGADDTRIGYGTIVHKGNIILGKIAFRENNLEKAKEHLLISVRVPLRLKYGSVAYPDLELAEELLKKGEKETVLEFLKLCEGLIGTDTESLKKWQKEIGQGKTPDFKWF